MAEEKKANGAAPEKKPPEKKPPEKKAASKGKKITVKLGGEELEGLAVSKRKAGKMNQVYVKLTGRVSRWVNEKDIVK